jgi:hypothetical protein
MSWDPYIYSFQGIDVGAYTCIDLTGLTLSSAAPDWTDYGYRVFHADDVTADDHSAIDWNEEPYPHHSLYAYLNLTDPWTEEMMIAFAAEYGSAEMFMPMAPTGYPEIYSSGENSGLMANDRPFKWSWAKAMWRMAFDGPFEDGTRDDTTGNPLPNMSGFYGRWDILDDFYLNKITTCPYFFPFNMIKTEGMFTYSFDEVYVYHKQFHNAPGSLDGNMLNSNLMNATTHRGLYEVASDVDGSPIYDLDTEAKYQTFWPRFDVSDYDTSHDERDYRKFHVATEARFGTYQRVHTNLYKRYVHPDYNRGQRDTYISNRVTALVQMLELAESLPKEYRVRMQPHSHIQASQLSFLPSETATTAGTSTSAPTPTSPTGGEY